ncbi:hypothetical protein AVE30378_02526 [Achromobacter veterisilvae]|uniref:Uncharacterized protein n=1 Tax=Achromobacter veterisilvae TaxID=2069367 RepID=A0A446CHA9_9BURK|nr:hypothetical protein [Achromobacter veterisilvae]SSW67250.1 hypothetical protein AVE30378_02526 [Achromobacter veterisilvae]
MNAPIPLPSTAEIYQDALDHIRRTARASSTQTRRLRWIASRAETALQGRPYIAAEHAQPKMVTDSVALQRKNLALRIANARLRTALAQIAGGSTGILDRDFELAQIAQAALDAEQEAGA